MPEATESQMMIEKVPSAIRPSVQNSIYSDRNETLNAQSMFHSSHYEMRMNASTTSMEDHHDHDHHDDENDDARELQRREQQHETTRQIYVELRRTLHLVEQKQQQQQGSSRNDNPAALRCQMLWYQLQRQPPPNYLDSILMESLGARVDRVCPTMTTATTTTTTMEENDKVRDPTQPDDNNVENTTASWKQQHHSQQQQDRQQLEATLEQMARQIKHETAQLYQSISHQNQHVLNDLHDVHKDGELLDQVTDVTRKVRRNNQQHQGPAAMMQTWYRLGIVILVFLAMCNLILMAPKRTAPCLLFCSQNFEKKDVDDRSSRTIDDEYDKGYCHSPKRQQQQQQSDSCQLSSSSSSSESTTVEL
mmetsp:Transcript_20965/g.58019  ORF Transcript_20965/g.58019 Transcript_20965/m.58019 type:complete len:363 (-) Transcript_20965:224-1312(-)